jgi:hypothetical protein
LRICFLQQTGLGIVIVLVRQLLQDTRRRRIRRLPHFGDQRIQTPDVAAETRMAELFNQRRRQPGGRLIASDRLFHWSGPAVVAILDRQQSFDQVRALVRRVLDKPLQETWDNGGRSVLIPLSAIWSVVMIDSMT